MLGIELFYTISASIKTTINKLEIIRITIYQCSTHEQIMGVFGNWDWGTIAFDSQLLRNRYRITSSRYQVYVSGGKWTLTACSLKIKQKPGS